MLILAVGMLVVVPWCGHRDVGVFHLGVRFWRRNSDAFVTPLLPVNCWSSSVCVLDPTSMREACCCDDFGCCLSHYLALVWMARCWKVCLGGVFWRCCSAVTTNPLLSVNFWCHLRVSRVVGRMSGYIAAALTLTSPLL